MSLIPTAAAGLPIWALTGSKSEARNFATSLFADVSSALIGLNLVVRGEQYLWKERPAVFVFNHQSKVDVVIMAKLLRRDIAGVGKKEIKSMPLIGKTLELAGTIFIDRENSASAIEAMKPLVDAMRNQGKSVAIAPEGTRSITPKLASFKKGPFHLAMQAGVPVVPVVIHNSGDVAPKGDFVFRPATVEVDVLPPVDTSEWRRETIEEHVAEIREMFLETLGQGEELDFVAARPPRKIAALKKGVKKKSAKKRGAKKKAVVPKKKVIGKKVLKKKASKKTALKKKVLKKTATKKAVLKKKALKKKALKKKAVTGKPS